MSNLNTHLILCQQIKYSHHPHFFKQNYLKSSIYLLFNDNAPSET